MADSIREALHNELEDTRRDFAELVESLSPQDWTKPTPNPAWNVGEMMFHISVAPRFLPADIWLIQQIGTVIYPPGFIFHRFNEWYTRRMARRYTLATITEAYDEAHARCMRSFASVGDSEWTKSAQYPGWDPMLSGRVTLEDLFRYVRRHFEAHAAEIRASVEP